MIKQEGQEVSLQNELRLISLQHLTIACDYALRYNYACNEKIDSIFLSDLNLICFY